MKPLPPGFVLIKILYIDGVFYFASITGELTSLTSVFVEVDHGLWPAISTANICVALFASVGPA